MADCDALRLGDRRRKPNSRPDTQKATGLYDVTARHYFDILTLHALLCLTINHRLTVFELCLCNARLETTRGDSKRWRCIHQADACSIWTLCVRTHHPCPFPPLVGAHIFVRYEWFLSLDFDWDFLTGAKRFRWPMVSGFNPRYPICSQHLHYTDLLLRQPISLILRNDRNVSLLNFLSSLSLISVCIQCCCS